MTLITKDLGAGHPWHTPFSLGRCRWVMDRFAEDMISSNEKPSLMGWAFPKQLSISILPIPGKLPALGKWLDWGELRESGVDRKFRREKQDGCVPKAARILLILLSFTA